MAQDELTPGTVLAGKYKVIKQIGRGGFSHIYKATQIGMGRPVALKILKAHLTQTDQHDRQAAEFTRRFEKEAVALSRLRSPATVTVYDFGVALENRLYMALEFVDGQALDTILAQEGKLSPARVVKIMQQALESLREAHYYGILHRDIKPSNIMLYAHMDEVDQVKLLDFGIAKLYLDQDDNSPDQTRRDALIGTPAYMAPEAISNNAVPASDIYSLSMVAYELLTGERAVGGRGNLAVITKQLSPTPIALPEDLFLPESLRRILTRMMEKDLTRRFSDAREVLTELAALDISEAEAAFTRPAHQAPDSVRLAFERAQQLDEASSIPEETTPALHTPPMIRALATSLQPSLPDPPAERIIELSNPIAPTPSARTIATPTRPVPAGWEESDETRPLAPLKQEKLIVLEQKVTHAPAPVEEGASSAPTPEALLHPEEVTEPERSVDAASKARGMIPRALLAALVILIVAALAALYFAGYLPLP